MRMAYALAGRYRGSSAAEGRIQRFARGLGELGAPCCVVALNSARAEDPPGRWLADEHGIPYTVLSRPMASRFEAWRFFFRSPGILLEGIARALEEQAADVVCYYGNSWYTAAPILGYCLRRGVPVIADCNEWYALRPDCDPLYWDRQLLVRRLLPSASGIVGISRFWIEHCRRRGVPAVLVPALGEPESPPPPPYSHRRGDPFTLTYVGMLSGRDLPQTLLEGLRRAVRGGVDARLVVVGDMGEKATARRAVRTARADPVLKDRVTFTGFLSDDEVRRRLAQTHATVLLRPQTRETRACFPTRLTDYLRAGRPVVLSDAGDVPLYFRHRHSAWLLPAGERPEELAGAIAHLAANAQEASAIGLEGRKTGLEEFSYRRHAPRILEFLQGLRV